MAEINFHALDINYEGGFTLSVADSISGLTLETTRERLKRFFSLISITQLKVEEDG